MLVYKWAIERRNATERLHEKVDHGSMRFGHIRYIETGCCAAGTGCLIFVLQSRHFEFCRYGCTFPDAIAA